ncbi:helix-turn-helix domain-containing protein [Streptomyces durbertensis]|uniref:Helix-turn-helix domain-containing protein n=1 Tax=Streptomyces durbertensis TaxID=2448886 RepID=A0ABR6EKZ6_9ACTN|nr:helix-turn-helix domain-containing protein [Streptomyces durbertensis]MBB1245982.1 helix-turn-helix domain-containing protein [Streptomyces durbertensis]
MCELLNRIWSRPRGEWTRVLRKELPAITDQVVEVLRQTLPAHKSPAVTSREDLHWAVEQALLTALGYQKEPQRERPTGKPVAVPVPIDRARRNLFAAVTGDLCALETPLSELARSARWPLPERVRAVVLTSPGEATQLAASLGDTLLSLADGEACLLVPDQGPETRAALETALRGRIAAVGHGVALSDAAASLRWARRLLALAPSRPVTETLFVEDHLTLLLLLQDETLARALAGRWLGPLEELTPRQSERLEVTLLAWLEGGGAPEAAKTLQVHPQTVRYRLRQIEKLFGSALRDPRTRFELEMTLRSRRLMAQVRRHTRPTRRARVAVAGMRPLGLTRQARVNGL